MEAAADVTLIVVVRFEADIWLNEEEPEITFEKSYVFVSELQVVISWSGCEAELQAE